MNDAALYLVVAGGIALVVFLLDVIRVSHFVVRQSSRKPNRAALREMAWYAEFHGETGAAGD